jgi:predicted  nucleic acid-binding Zn-ribbon protein
LENKLRQLYTLQLIDNSLDELEELKGDLPHQVRTLEEKHLEIETRRREQEQIMRNAFTERDSADTDILTLREKLSKYKAQQFEVRNNKEYDALTREMDHAQVTIVRLEKAMTDLENVATRARTEVEQAQTSAEALAAHLEEKRRELAEVSKETEDEELKYRHERQKVVARIPREDLVVYERIRKAKKGRAVVGVKRGACGGCFNRVPPQKLLELRQHKHVYTCERCGRILVSDEIVEHSTQKA